MALTITAIPIHRGKVLEGTTHSYTIQGGVTNEDVGRVVLTAYANARLMGWHLIDPETWLRLEFRNHD